MALIPHAAGSGDVDGFKEVECLFGRWGCGGEGEARGAECGGDADLLGGGGAGSVIADVEGGFFIAKLRAEALGEVTCFAARGRDCQIPEAIICVVGLGHTAAIKVFTDVAITVVGRVIVGL